MSKKGKPVEVPSTTLPRLPSRVGTASIVSRFTLVEKPKTPRIQRFARYARLAPKHLRPQQTDFKIRTSVADLVMKELEDYDRCIFYQRVYILAKNILLTATAESSMESILSKYMQSKSSLTSYEAQAEAAGEETMEGELDEMSHLQAKSETETVNLIEAKSSKEDLDGMLLKLTKDDFKTVPKEKRMQQLDFFDQFKTRLEEIVKSCDADQLSEDRLSGLLLCMGNSHTLLMLEGTEDTIANFCQELLNISSEFFEIMRVFMVEDRIEETYFDEFVYRRSVAMNITEKFSPPTANDPYLMGPQHWLIKEKLHTICRSLSYELRPVVPEIMDIPIQPTIVIIDEEQKEPKKRRIIKKTKKSPKRKKELADQPTQPRTSIRSGKAGSGDMTSLQSAARLSTVSAGSAQRPSMIASETEQVEADTREEQADALSMAAVEIPAPPATAVEDTLKTEDYTIGKETSVVKLNTLATIMGEQETEAAILEDDEELEPREFLSEFALSAAVYNRLLPEVQRIELVLTSKRFYMDVSQFLRLSQQVPMQPDEDASMWPTQYNYLPLNIFQRMPFDVNLTFGSYDVNDTESDESSSEGEEKEGGKDGEKKKEEAG